MDFFFALFVAGFLVALILLLTIAVSDCDLTLKFYEKFGTPIEKKLSRKVVWIVGASSGIGENLAKEFAKINCKLILTARRTDLLDRIKRECNELGAENVAVLPLDITSIVEHENSVNQAFEFFGSVDILVCNAGRSQRARFEEVDIQVDRDIFEVNVFGLVNLATVVVQRFLKAGTGGHIAVTSSLVGRFAFPGSRSYTASKHALHGYFDTLRMEHYCHNIHVTMLCPGPVKTDFLKVAFTAEAGNELGQNTSAQDKRMTVERCAHLSAVAIANKIDEAWISMQPVLAGYYLSQYIPSISKKVFAMMGNSMMMKFRDSRNFIKKE